MHRLVAATLLLLGALSVSHAKDVSVTVRWASADALDVAYTLPPTCTSLRFLKDGRDAARIRARWQPEANCGTAGGDTLQRGAANCPAGAAARAGRVIRDARTVGADV